MTFHVGCLEKNTRLYGNNRDITGNWPNVKTARDCQKECQLNPRCKEFNFQEVEPFKCLLKYGKMAKWKYENGNCDACKDWTYGPKSCNEGKYSLLHVITKSIKMSLFSDENLHNAMFQEKLAKMRTKTINFKT